MTPTAPPPQEINGCILDTERLNPLRPCMECCGPESPRDEWNHSCIHPSTVAYACGCLFRPGQANNHNHDAEELARCRQWASEAAALMTGIEINESESTGKFAPFFVTANRDDKLPTELSEQFVRSAFNGTIYPLAKITLAPLNEDGRAWRAFAVTDWRVEFDTSNMFVLHEHKVDPKREAVINAAKEEARLRNEQTTVRWRELFRWFEAQPSFRDKKFVLIGENQLSDVNYGCVFPRLVVALTASGSLVGIASHAVHT